MGYGGGGVMERKTTGDYSNNLGARRCQIGPMGAVERVRSREVLDILGKESQ